MHSAGVSLYQKVRMVAEQLVSHSVESGKPLLGAGPVPQSSGRSLDTSRVFFGFCFAGSSSGHTASSSF